MTTTPASANVAALSGQLQQGLTALSNLGLNPNAATGGGGAGAAPQAGAQANATALPGAVAANLQGDQQPMKVPGTGAVQKLYIGDKWKYFEAAPVGKEAKEITAFQYIDAHKFSIKLDYKDGLATGLANLSRVFGARQERVRQLSEALGQDASQNGAFSPVDMQKLNLETTTTQQLSEMQKKIFDSMRDAIQAWLR